MRNYERKKTGFLVWILSIQFIAPDFISRCVGIGRLCYCGSCSFPEVVYQVVRACRTCYAYFVCQPLKRLSFILKSDNDP